MADERIEDINSGTKLANIVADAQFVVLDPDDSTDDADGTAKPILAATMGLLETKVSAVNADVTGAVGVLDVVDISGYTADRDYILPTTAAVGDRAGICLSVGDASFELDIHTVSASTDTINGVDSSVGTASYTRVFITGEIMIFRCTVANTAWIVEQDGRIPCVGKMALSGNDTVTTGTWTQVAWDTSLGDTGNIVATGSNGFITRRAGDYSLSVRARSVGNLTDGSVCAVRCYDGTNYFVTTNIRIGSLGLASAVASGDEHGVAAGVTITSQVNWSGTTPAVDADGMGSTGDVSSFEITEIL